MHIIPGGIFCLVTKLSRSVPVCEFSNFPSTMMRHQFRYKIIFLKQFKVTIDNMCILCHKDMQIMQYFLVTCIERVSHSCESDTYLLFKIYITLIMNQVSLVECDIKIYKFPII